MTLRDLLVQSMRCDIVLMPHEVQFELEPIQMLRQLSEHDYSVELDAQFIGDHMIYPWFDVEYDCAEDGGLYFYFKLQPNLADASRLDVEDVLPGLC
jgi:hypothetical protein